MRLCRSLKETGYHQVITDPQIRRTFDKNAGPAGNGHRGFHHKMGSMISTHIDDVKGGATETEQ
eukprot:940937-Prorocentrum_lima.AAC.1